MKHLILTILTITCTIHFAIGQTLFSEDFEGKSLGAVSTTPPPVYQINNLSDPDCGIGDGWNITTTNAAGTACSGCSGNRASIEYGSSTCSQDYTLVTGTFAPSCASTIRISFNYGFDNEDGGESFTAILYNETDATTEAILVSTTVDVDNGAYSNAVAYTAGKTYSLRFTYVGEFDWGATVDNIVVESTGPSANFTQNCNSDLSYSVQVQVTDMASGTSVDITDNSGATIYFDDVTIGTYTVTNLSGAETIKVTNNTGCTTEQAFAACEPCALTSAPSDLCSNAPLVNLSQEFYGSTDCSYTPTNDGVGTDTDGPDAFCGTIQNDSWLKFIPSSDSVVLDWEITGGSSCSSGIQLAVFDGNCSNYDAMVQLACQNPTGGIGSTGTFEVTSLNIGQEYFLYIDGYAGDRCDYYWNPITGVATLPPNDSCQNAIVLACGNSDTSGIVLATNDDVPSGCSGGGTPSKGVWYRYIGTGDTAVVSTDNAETNFDTQINVYTGTCGSLTCLTADDDSGTGTTSEVRFASTAATEYFIYVDGDGASEGQFEISIQCVANTCNADAGTWD